MRDPQLGLTWSPANSGHAGFIRCFLTADEDEAFLKAFVRPWSPKLQKDRDEKLKETAGKAMGDAIGTTDA